MANQLRFQIGAAVMCNLGSRGWQLGRVIALHYRESHWPADRVAPYQVALENDHDLIFVPYDDSRVCREATSEDRRIARRMDALAALPPGLEDEPEPVGRTTNCCDCCPGNWGCAELYSEHYRCSMRNELKVTRRTFDLGTIRVGDTVHCGAEETTRGGFMQCPTLVRLPPGVRFSDDGSLSGEVRFDPYRNAAYGVEFVAVSTVEWNNPAVGIVRLEITFDVAGNAPPDGFDARAFAMKQEKARDLANQKLDDLVSTWQQWEQGRLGNRDTCDQMCADLGQLRLLCEQNPRLDGGRWWAQLGGFHMNVHKLLENKLFECELYLGHALTFGEPEVRHMAEQNLSGCYQKRLLEAARFMWMDGIKQMMRGEWAAAAETLQLAAAKKDGWGWAVNYGDIWLSESAARLVHGAELRLRNRAEDGDGSLWVAEAAQLVERGAARAMEGGIGVDGHPWASEIRKAIDMYRSLQEDGADATSWLQTLKQRTVYWCAQVLGGAPPFPPKPKPRAEDAAELARRLPGHNA